MYLIIRNVCWTYAQDTMVIDPLLVHLVDVADIPVPCTSSVRCLAVIVPMVDDILASGHQLAGGHGAHSLAKRSELLDCQRLHASYYA